jgi:flagellar protein FlaJ
MRYIDRKKELMILGVSLIFAVSILTITLIQDEYRPSSPYYIPLNQKTNNLIIGSFLIAILPVSIVEYHNNKWLKSVDKNVPKLLLDITESIRSGLSLFSALEAATAHDYGPISQPLEDAVVHMRMTADLEGSLKSLGKQLQRPSAMRMITILLETYETGGRMLDVLETSIDMFTYIEEYQEEKSSQISPYILLVYVGSIIFLIISYTIIEQFLGPILKVSMEQHVAESGILRNVLEERYYKSILFWASSIEGLFGGLVAGKILDDRTSGGLIHSVILLLITLGFFNLVLV